MVEDMQTSQEELKSANEELQSTNEELQSTNEELTTSREEMQSLNEELSTLNSELQAKNDELSDTNNDLRNLLDSTQVPTLFLDNELRIKRYTPKMSKVVNLLPSDIGRSISDITTNLNDVDLVKGAKDVLRTLNSKEIKIQSKDSSWYLMHILPYRTVENVIDGLVITFYDITETKKLEESLQSSKTYAENIVETIREPLLVLDPDMKIVSANRAFYKTFQVAPEETVGKVIYRIGNNQWDIPELHRLLEDVLEKNNAFEDYEVEHDFPRIGHRIMRLNARRIKSEAGSQLTLLAIEDVMDQGKTSKKQQM